MLSKSLKMGFVNSQNVWNQIKIWTLTSLHYPLSHGSSFRKFLLDVLPCHLTGSVLLLWAAVTVAGGSFRGSWLGVRYPGCHICVYNIWVRERGWLIERGEGGGGGGVTTTRAEGGGIFSNKSQSSGCLKVVLYRVAPQKTEQSIFQNFALITSDLLSPCWIEELFILWVISYGLSFSGFARFPELRSSINDKLINGKSRKWQSIRNYS